MTRRTCPRCGAIVPWGAPQCVGCGAWTIWRRLLASFGLLVGAGAALAVVASMVRLWLLPPPPEVKASLPVHRFLEEVAQAPTMRGLVLGAGRCQGKPARTLCVHMASDFERFSEATRAGTRKMLEDIWARAADLPRNDVEVVLVSRLGHAVPQATPPA